MLERDVQRRDMEENIWMKVSGVANPEEGNERTDPDASGAFRSSSCSRAVYLGRGLSSRLQSVAVNSLAISDNLAFGV